MLTFTLLLVLSCLVLAYPLVMTVLWYHRATSVGDPRLQDIYRHSALWMFMGALVIGWVVVVLWWRL